MSRPAGLLFVAALSAFCAVACTAGQGGAGSLPPSARSSAARVTATGRPSLIDGLWAHEQPPADCPVTLGSASAEPPSSIPADAMPVPWAANWFGNSTLWTRLPPTGVLPVQPGQQGRPAWNTKFPWWRTIPGQLTVRAHRLGGTGEFQADVSAGYPPTGFQSSDLNWSALGCWQITADNAGGTLTFTVWLEPLPAG